ncbi:MAG: peptidase [Cyanobacteria bacterium QS_8_64_29]|nr:MAG: peptidase [Cyanobacteria bacterium QS_8_64_29]
MPAAPPGGGQPLAGLLGSALIAAAAPLAPTLAAPPEPPAALPQPRAHPVPQQLKRQFAPQAAGNYLDRIEPTRVGYLVWSQLPVRISLAHPPEARASSARQRRFQRWQAAVRQAIADWDQYLPLSVVASPERADIRIARSQPPRQSSGQRARARAGRTRYTIEVCCRAQGPPRLHPQGQIALAPGQSRRNTLSSARHELGHALGLWGHSRQSGDVMYGAHTGSPTSISQRDANTLYRLYRQPTRLGWPLQLQRARH